MLLLAILLTIIPVLGLIFLSCDLGQRLSNVFDEFNNDAWTKNWYLYPLELQRMFLLFGAGTQQSVNIRCYGNILCIRETMRKVIY